MEESEDNMSSEDLRYDDGSLNVKTKPKKRSLVERELETNLTARVTSPITNSDSSSTSRYGRARRLKTGSEHLDVEKPVMKNIKSPNSTVDKSPAKVQSPAYKMHASNSPIRVETPKRSEQSLENQIESIYTENISLSRFGSDEKKCKSSTKKYPKVYIRKDLIQSKEKDTDDTVVLIKNMFSPTNSSSKKSDFNYSSEKYTTKKPNGYLNSVVKTLDFDGNKKKVEKKSSLSKSELFELEAKSEYQVGDLAWARMGTYPFWPCIVTRDPASEMFVKKKLFGRIERDVLHVTFFGDNGRRGWIVDSMLRKFLGQLEFEAARTNFTPEAKKKDPRLYAAFFISEKKMPLWQLSVEEAETLLREPKRLRIDILYDMLEKSRISKSTPKQEKSKKITRTDSDVSLSESLYDTLFSEDDSKSYDSERPRSKSRNRSLNVSEVVTACLDNMAAKTGITKIQRQSHMDRWLQKAKSKTPEKAHLKSHSSKVSNSAKTKKKLPQESTQSKKLNRYRKSSESQSEDKLKSHQNEHDYSQTYCDRNSPIILDDVEIEYENAEIFTSDSVEPGSGIGIISKVETLCDKELLGKNEDMILTVFNDEIVLSEASGNGNRQINQQSDITSVSSSETILEDSRTNADIAERPSRTESVTDSANDSMDIDSESNDVVTERSVDESYDERHENFNDNDVLKNSICDESSNKILSTDNVEGMDVSEQKNNKSNNINEIHDYDLSLTNAFCVSSSENKPTEKPDVNEENVNKNNFHIIDKNKKVDKKRVESNCTESPRRKSKRLAKDSKVDDITNGTSDNFTEVIHADNVNVSCDSTVPDEEIEKNYNQKDNVNDKECSNHQKTEENKFNTPELNQQHNNIQIVENGHCYLEDDIINNGKENIEIIKSNPKGNSPKIFKLSLKKSVDKVNISNDDKFSTTDKMCENFHSTDIAVETNSVTNRSSIEPITIEELIKNDFNGCDDQNFKINGDINHKKVSDFEKEFDTCSPNILNNAHNIIDVEININNDVNMCDDLSLQTKIVAVIFNEHEANEIASDNTELAGSVEQNQSDIVDQNASDKNDLDAETNSVVENEAICEVPSSNSPSIPDNTSKKKDLDAISNKDLEIAEKEADTMSVKSEDSSVSLSKKKQRTKDKHNKKNMLEDSEFLKYLELRQDALIDEHPELSQEDITNYLYKTWLYEESLKTDTEKADDIDHANLVKGQNQDAVPVKKIRKRTKVEKERIKDPSPDIEDKVQKEKSKRKIVRPYYKEEFSDADDDIEYYDIFNMKPKSKVNSNGSNKIEGDQNDINEMPMEYDEEMGQDELDQVEEYFRQLTSPKPNLFKGLIREKVCEICERVGNLVKCKGCHCMFHVDCDKKPVEVVEVSTPIRGRKKKKKTRGRKAKEDCLDSGSQSDEKSQDANVSEEMQNTSIDEEESHIVANADEFEAQLSAKMKEVLENPDNLDYDSYEELDWNDIDVGDCKIVDIKPRAKDRVETDYSDFKCSNCLKHDIPVCFVCKSDLSPKNRAAHRQRCQVAHCQKYYHLECLDHWPQTQFNAGELSRTNKSNEYSEALSCPRHVCHTCVCDDPRGCKTRFSGDKLARCIRCPATYHTFTKCLPAGTQILTGSHIICPRHYEHRPGKVPCHVNTGWCFICALGGSLICCEYCPTSFHAECLNIKPPEGGYMCEDCETGRLPLYGEMVWVKLGHYRWWPGIILHPSEIPQNILAVKHSPGEFVVRFFGQYDHYWVNRGRVFPFQEGDSGKVSSQKSKIDAAFTMAMEHAQRACEILKTASPNQEESLDIASSLLPPHYVKLKTNKPCGSLCGRKVDAEESSLTQCECAPGDAEPCGAYTQCLNRMLLTECGPTCRAGDRCNNRAFEKRLYPKMTPYRTPHRGWGLKTLVDIKAGQFVIEYVGELIDEDEFQRRMRRKHEVRDENFYFLTLDKERMIDAGPKGNFARFMNHSCEPNCETQKWTVLGDIRVGLFAIYDIPANSELTFNYNLESAGIEKKRCMCGAKRCSGYIGAKPKQDEQPKKAKLQTKRTYKKRKTVEDSPSTSRSRPRNRVGRPHKPRELTEIEKDLLIIRSATGGLSSDSECSGPAGADNRALKRKRTNLSTEESASQSVSPCSKRMKGDAD